LDNKNGTLALTNGRLILPDRILTGQALVLLGNKIQWITAEDKLNRDVKKIDVGGRYISPGLVDIHTHGALGHSFNEPAPDAFTTITIENARHGITSLLATIATASIPDMLGCLEICRQRMQGPRDGAQILGAHLEGPYFSMAKRGAQNPQNIRTPDDGTHQDLLVYPGMIKIMSYAPELPGALDLTTQLSALGIVPAAGHSSATDEHIFAAQEAGLKHVIHLYCGQSSVVKEGPWRKPGLLEAVLASDDLTGELIADNKHLPPTLMKLAYKCLGPDRLCVVSDATSGAGLPEGAAYHMGDMEYRVQNGVGMMLDGSSFAGSTTLLNEMLPTLVDMVCVPVPEAVRMASLTPARVIGVDDRKGSLAAGKDADIVIFEEDFTPWRTMIFGQWVDL